MSMVLPMTLKEAQAAADVTSLANLLGTVYEVEPGKKYRLVKLASAAFGTGTGADSAAKKAFKWSSRADWTVVPCSAATDRICGVSPPELPNLAVGDVFLVQILGRCTLTVAGDQTVTAGNYVIPDDDADKGKVADGSTTYTEGVDFCQALESQGTGDGEFDAEIVKELN